MKTLVVLSGEINDYTSIKYHIKNADLIICADGGARHLIECGVEPHILLGDFDSISKEDYNYYLQKGIEIHTYEREKDMTDSEIAIRLAIEKGSDNIVILGGMGSRLDHSLANIFMLKTILEKGVNGIIVNDNNEASLICNSIDFEKREGYKVSLIPITEKVKGVNTSGLYYPLNDAVLEFGSTLGLSNEFAAPIASVSINNGLLLVVLSKD